VIEAACNQGVIILLLPASVRVLQDSAWSLQQGSRGYQVW